MPRQRGLTDGSEWFRNKSINRPRAGCYARSVCSVNKKEFKDNTKDNLRRGIQKFYD